MEGHTGRDNVFGTGASATPTQVVITIILPKDALSMITENSTSTGLNRVESERQVSSARPVNRTATSGLIFGILDWRSVQEASGTLHMPSRWPPEALLCSGPC